MFLGRVGSPGTSVPERDRVTSRGDAPATSRQPVTSRGTPTTAADRRPPTTRGTTPTTASTSTTHRGHTPSSVSPSRGHTPKVVPTDRNQPSGLNVDDFLPVYINFLSRFL